MDKDLIIGLSSLSESLDRIADALSKKGDPKTATATALKMGQFDKQIREISNSITIIRKDTKKILDQQDTILKILKKKEKDSKIDEKKEKIIINSNLEDKSAYENLKFIKQLLDSNLITTDEFLKLKLDILK